MRNVSAVIKAISSAGLRGPQSLGVSVPVTWPLSPPRPSGVAGSRAPPASHCRLPSAARLSGRPRADSPCSPPPWRCWGRVPGGVRPAARCWSASRTVGELPEWPLGGTSELQGCLKITASLTPSFLWGNWGTEKGQSRWAAPIASALPDYTSGFSSDASGRLGDLPWPFLVVSPRVTCLSSFVTLIAVCS